MDMGFKGCEGHNASPALLNHGQHLCNSDFSLTFPEFSVQEQSVSGAAGSYEVTLTATGGDCDVGQLVMSFGPR